MHYLSGIHALNIPCSLLTCGDWHQSALQWSNLTFLDSEKSPYGDYGIECNKRIPEHDGTYNVANHIRALLDLLGEGNFSVAQGMNKDFICNDKYTEEIFNKVAMLKDSEKWHDIDRFMGKEYYSNWIDFKGRMKI